MSIDLIVQYIYSYTKNTALTVTLLQTLIVTCYNFIYEVNEFHDLNCELSETLHVIYYIKLYAETYRGFYKAG